MLSCLSVLKQYITDDTKMWQEQKWLHTIR